MEQFEEEFELTPDTLVLDVGGTEYNWTLISSKPKIVILNLSLPTYPSSSNSIVWLVADARYLPFKQNIFSIVYSNSVIEHLSTIENQSLFANECRRVGKKFYVQTPNKWFPVEPHYITVFLHWLPGKFQRGLIRYFSIHGWITRPSQDECDRMVNEIRLLSGREFQKIFPEAEIWREKVIGLTKSLIAVKNAKINGA